MTNINKAYFLYPSKLYLCKNSTDVITVLGSCVSVCLYDNNKKFGGINHYMLPLWNGKGLPSPKFGNIAIKKLIEKMLDQGSNKKDLVAKVFGGGEVIKGDHKLFQIGQRNIEIANQILNEYDIKIIKQSTGGKQGRKIMYRTGSGEVLMKLVQNNMYNSLTEEEIIDTEI